MLLHAYQLLAILAPGLIQITVAPFQAGEFLGIPIWGWLLLALSGFLLLTFIIIVALDWKSAGERTENEDSS